jgi:sugar phosphate isomerase/epimerase
MRVRRTTVAVALAAAFVVALIIGALGGIWAGPSSHSDRIDALVERTCEIVRDIAGDAAAGVNTVSETRGRLKHLLDGYGVNAPADIQTALRNTVGAMTTVTLDASLGRLESACSVRGF